METPTNRLILVVDSNPGHVQVIQQVLAKPSQQLVAIASGSEALDYLHQRGDYVQSPRPDLILLDLHLGDRLQPDEDPHGGLDILTVLKAHDQLRRIPVVVLTSSEDPDDVLRSYTLQGNCYVVKATDFTQLAAIVKEIEDFWLEIVTLPLE